MSRTSLTSIAISLSSVFFASFLAADSYPADLDVTLFADSSLTPSPACLCVSAEGDVYVGVDLNGSLGKGPGKGRIVKLIDTDRDGIADSHTVFAEIDNARGLIAVGTKLYVLHTAYGPDGLSTGMDLVVLDDANRDGIADGPAQMLVSNICSAQNINGRGTDHSTNGIRMGIDGWIYIAVGDFGFHDALGTDGTKLTLLGGGVVRVRPDGTELELYTTGSRNIYDVAIDPFMNTFTRGNTNDGGSWNVRFLHHLQSGEYGYPRLFLNFTSEIIPALEDVGGGSGVGALFLDEPTWPAHYNNQPLMGDWGRKAIYLHRLSPDGASFTQNVEEFVQVSQLTDLDVDPAGQMFISAWDGAGFRGNDKRGYVVRVTPKGWKLQPTAIFGDLSSADLVAQLKSASSTTRSYAQQELLARPQDFTAIKTALIRLTRTASEPLAIRVAALYTLAQIETDPVKLLAFAADDALNEFALRAAADRLPRLKDHALPLAPFITALHSGTARQQAAAAVALGRIGNLDAAAALLSVPFTKPSDHQRPTITEKFTVKSGRSPDIELAVTPGEELRLHVIATDTVGGEAEVILRNGVFNLADGSTIGLETLTPTGGNITTHNAPPLSKNKKATPKKYGPAIRVTGPALTIYTAPPHAVSFTAKGEPTSVADTAISAEIFASTGRTGVPVSESTGPRHATPNASILVPHLAAHALVRLRAVEACLASIGTPSEDLALWALSGLHEEASINGLQSALKTASAPTQRAKLLTTLARLHHRESPYDGSWWWTTRPDTRGPYYKPETWSASPQIAGILEAEIDGARPAQLDYLARLNDSHRLGLTKLGTRIVEADLAELPSVDLAKIASQKGAVASTPIEDIILAMDTLKPDHLRGAELFTQQGCVACHALESGGPSLGPFMGQVGSIMNVEQIATAILRPNDTISQGFQTVVLTMKDGSVKTGFASETTADKIVLRDLTGGVTTVATADIKDEQHLPISMMPEGLANALSLDELAALVHFLAEKK